MQKKNIKLTKKQINELGALYQDARCKDQVRFDQAAMELYHKAASAKPYISVLKYLFKKGYKYDYAIDKLALYLGITDAARSDPYKLLMDTADQTKAINYIASYSKMLHAIAHVPLSMRNSLILNFYHECNFELHDSDKYLSYDIPCTPDFMNQHKDCAYHHFMIDANTLVNKDPYVGLLASSYESYINDVINTTNQKGLDVEHHYVRKQPGCFYHAAEIDRFNLLYLINHGVDAWELSEYHYSTLQGNKQFDGLFVQLPNYFIMHYFDNDVLNNDGWSFPFYINLSSDQTHDPVFNDGNNKGLQVMLGLVNIGLIHSSISKSLFETIFDTTCRVLGFPIDKYDRDTQRQLYYVAIQAILNAEDVSDDIKDGLTNLI